MKSFLQLNDTNEAAIEFNSISYNVTKQGVETKLDGNTYLLATKTIAYNKFTVKEITKYLDYLISMSKKYITISTPVDGVTCIEQW